MDFYVSLPSHSSKTEYPENRSNHFKIRLPHPLKMEGANWKVGLSSISLPDPKSQVPPLLQEDDVMFEGYWFVEDTVQLNNRHNADGGDFKPEHLRADDLSNLTGVEFMKTVKTFFDTTVLEKRLRAGYLFADKTTKKSNLLNFQFEGDDFVFENTNVNLRLFNGHYYPQFYVNLELSIDMGWFKKNGNKVELGPNLSMELNNKELKVPAAIDISPTTGHPYWKLTPDGKRVHLTATFNWRFINLNTSFKNVTGSTSRSLMIYLDVGTSGVVGNQVTDLLREVNYLREGKGFQYFEPLHVQYIAVRKDYIDIIETQVAETTGELTKFGAGNTIVTLQFK